MKTLRFIAALMFFAAVAAIPSLAQTGGATAPTQPNMKVAIIDTSLFADEKRGIQKFISAYKQLETEFTPRRTEITGIENRLKQIQTDYSNLVKQQGTAGSPVSADAVQKKLEEGQNLQTEYNRKVEDYKAAVQKREAALVGPIYQDIGKALQDYAKRNGFMAIIDISKDQNAMILVPDMSSVDATTTDFIRFYNARPAGTAAATNPAAPK
ncbi:MAG: OmpH family outer membrane protein [Acidobacteriota bacterium]|nr:OmpH family outer membrane protein [Acidobacteriota bacterium]